MGCTAPCRCPSACRATTRGEGSTSTGSVRAAFTEADEQLCQAFTTQASIVVSNVQAYWASLELSRNLSRAMESRGVIEQAKGILMATRRVTADSAFDLLVARSQTENRKLREVAENVVREAALGDPDDRRCS
jgi:ANTAR domain